MSSPISDFVLDYLQKLKTPESQLARTLLLTYAKQRRSMNVGKELERLRRLDVTKEIPVPTVTVTFNFVSAKLVKLQRTTQTPIDVQMLDKFEHLAQPMASIIQDKDDYKATADSKVSAVSLLTAIQCQKDLSLPTFVSVEFDHSITFHWWISEEVGVYVYVLGKSISVMITRDMADERRKDNLAVPAAVSLLKSYYKLALQQIE